MADTMRAAVLHGVNDLRVEQVPRAQITRPDQALVRIGSVGICGSDVHYFNRGRIGDYIVTQPMILGHEAAGEVVEVGSEVTRLQVGDRVAIEPGCPDGTCAFCREGRYNLCPNVIFLATPPHDGAFADYLAWPAEYLYKLPDSLSLDEGAMLEPLSVGLFAVWRAGVRPGDSVAIFGAGPIGLTTLQCALAAGAATAIVVDVVETRLEIARKMGATATLGVSVENQSQIMDLTGGSGVHVAFECAGAVPAMQAAIRVTRSGGVVQLVGMPAEQEPTVPLYDIIGRELRVQGLFRYANTYPAAIALAAEGRVDLRSLVTKSFSLDEVPQAFPWVQEHREEVIKAVVWP
jgi:L-iditol 2-dehydrogenase